MLNNRGGTGKELVSSSLSLARSLIKMAAILVQFCMFILVIWNCFGVPTGKSYLSFGESTVFLT